jgi:DNA-binding SARP family transcriptional activator
MTGSQEQDAGRSTAVIKSKLAVPALPDNFVERVRVDELLTRLIDTRALIIVSATAGSGKSTAVVSALSKLDCDTAWLTVDRTDAAPGRLVTYLEVVLAERRPALAGIATNALAGGIPHPEAVGMLVEELGSERIVLAIDELERLEDEAEAWAVLEALVRYSPPALRLILLSRRDVPASVRGERSVGSVAVLGETHLAFTTDEAAEALAKTGTEDIDAAAAVEATGGWVTGVLFEAWRSTEHVSGAGGEADPLYGYLSSHILEQLSPEDREFLIACSLLDVVTAPKAAALGLTAAHQHLEALKAAHLPVNWSSDGRGMRCHSRFREYLLEQLEHRAGEEVSALRVAHARLLVAEGHSEEGVEEYLRAGALAEAKEAAEDVVLAVIERLDFAVVERWLKALGPLGPRDASPLATAELMLALARDDIGRGVAVADDLKSRGERDRLARRSDAAGGLMAWCYLHSARLDDVGEVLAAARPGPTVHTVRYAMRAVTDLPGEDSTPVAPQYTGGPLDALIGASDYFLGRLEGLTAQPASPWTEVVVLPWRIGALRASGHIEEALQLYLGARESGRALPGLEVFLGPEVLIDAGRREEAVAGLEEGAKLAAASGSLALQGHVALAGAKIALHIDRDPVAARAALDRPECRQAREAFRFVEEVAETRLGHACLLEGEDAAALEHLRRAVEGMLAGGRGLELPGAAVMLAEAEWRAGNEEESDRAADIALEAAENQGSRHQLLQALGMYPAVLSRRLDAEPSGDSAWHELGRALVAQGGTTQMQSGHGVLLREFGGAEILVDGEPVKAKIGKSYALLAYLAAHGSAPAGRDELLAALFEDSGDSARSYLRQAIRRLRDCLPDRAGLEVADGAVRLAGDVNVSSESVRFEQRLAEAARMEDAARLEATREALETYARGPYLQKIGAPWVDERRAYLERLATDARYEAAELAFGLGDIERAVELTDTVLADDPYREAAWRLRMRLASALGHEDRVIDAFHGCESALGELGASPSTATRRLLDSLRR